MSAIVAAFVSMPNFQRLPWVQSLDEGMSLPAYQPGFSWQARMGAELLQTHLTHTPAWGTHPILLLPGPNAAQLKSGSIFSCRNTEPLPFGMDQEQPVTSILTSLALQSTT